MSDDLNGGLPADDTALFSSVVESDQQPATPEPVVQQQPDPQPEPAIPPSRLREEADARRKAEGEAAELRGRLAAYEQRQQPKAEPQQQKPIPEPWDPGYTEYVQNLAREQAEQRYAPQMLALAKDSAIARFSEEKVTAAEQAFMQAYQSRTLDQADYDRVANAPNRYAAAVAWHQNQIVRQEVGNDPTAYKTRVLDEALKDPEFQKRVIEAARTQAQAAGNVIAQPARPQAQSLPSLNKIGAVALPDSGNDASDAELFASTTRRRAG